MLAVVLPTVVIPTYLVLKSEKALRFIQELTDRLSMLAALYLFFDILGLVIIILRNV